MGTSGSRTDQSPEVDSLSCQDLPQEIEKAFPGGRKHDPEGYKIYMKLMDALKNRPKGAKPRILVITDIEQDYDDLFAIIFLSEMHRLGVVEIAGCVANHGPDDLQKQRAYMLRYVLDLLNLASVPVAIGSVGSHPAEERSKFSYELRNKIFIDEGKKSLEKQYRKQLEEQGKMLGTDEEEQFEHGKVPDGEELIGQLAKETGNSKQPLTVLLLSSLQDITQYLEKQEEAEIQKNAEKQEDDRKQEVGKALRKNFKIFVSQGGYEVSDDGKDVKPNGNRNMEFNMVAAEKYTKLLGQYDLPSDTWTRNLASACLQDYQLIKDARTCGPIGKHINWIWLRQEFLFNWSAFNAFYLPALTPDWYVRTKLSISDPDQIKDTLREPPLFANLVKSGTLEVIVYDGYAALGTIGDDVLGALGVFKPDTIAPHNKPPYKHRIFGKGAAAGKPEHVDGVDTAQAVGVFRAFFLGALRATKVHADRTFRNNAAKVTDDDMHEPATYPDTDIETFEKYQKDYYVQWNDLRLNVIRSEKNNKSMERTEIKKVNRWKEEMKKLREPKLHQVSQDLKYQEPEFEQYAACPENPPLELMFKAHCNEHGLEYVDGIDTDASGKDGAKGKAVDKPGKPIKRTYSARESATPDP
ncbi:uncharacterized protein MKZ38_007125 [Zalerion maritima]|uniref:Inosine/uridine-preferring nucleoside hydrolase domain-containing protein n=1 Tax=Zalerion maritima TaxID=339359 RepID=A0AAD5RMZ7_9PEZI|nr:uncharacterized protein MKZ38_007125 [Zalerion maritima]